METKEVVAALGALAQPTRLEIFRRLVRAGPSGLSAGMISRELGVVASTLSHHLGLLEDARLIASTRQGRNVFYSCRIDGTRQLMTFLIQDCCDGRPDLCEPPTSASMETAAE